MLVLKVHGLKRLVLGLVSSLAVAGPLVGAEPDYLVAYDEVTEPLVPLVREVYAELGMSPQFVRVPSERAVQEADRGYYDADLSRAGGTLGNYPNLLYTHEPIKRTELYAYVDQHTNLTLNQLEELKQLRVGLLRGAKFAEMFAAQQGLQVIAANSVDALFAMLAAGRFDLVLITNTQLASQAQNYTAQIRRVGPLLSTSQSFHVLNRKHAELIPRFDAVLKAMREDGRLARYLNP